MRLKPIHYLEFSGVVIVLSLALSVAFPRFHSVQLQSRVDERTLELRSILDALMANERANPHTDAGSEAWNTALRSIASEHNLRLSYEAVGGPRRTHYFKSAPSSPAIIGLRIQGTVSRVQNEVLWAVAAPVPRDEGDRAFLYEFPLEDLAQHEPGLQGAGHWTWFLENPFNDFLKDRFDVSNGLNSDGVAIVWDRAPVSRPPGSP